MTSALQSDLTYLEPRSESWERIVDFVQHGIDLEESPDNATESEFWNRVAGNVPTGLWLDSGDIDAIDGLWNTRFPELSQDDWDHIYEDGKVPRLKHWMGRLAQGDLALDSLMNAAGTSAFMNSQQELDQRIKEHLQG